jgi:hypothetical protein
MQRNFSSRVDVAFGLADPALKDGIARRATLADASRSVAVEALLTSGTVARRRKRI